MHKLVPPFPLPLLLLLLLLVLYVPHVSAAGWNLDDCHYDSDCIDERICFYLDDDTVKPCHSDLDTCFCRTSDLALCTSSSSCGAGETCAAAGANDEGLSFCTSCDVVRDIFLTVDEGDCDPEPSQRPTTTAPTITTATDQPTATTTTTNTNTTSPDETTGEGSAENSISSNNDIREPNTAANELSICIAADALAHLPSHTLVYARHRRARVLCDIRRSCATPGHLVVHHGVAMMMSTYCNAHTVDGCQPFNRFVNTPRMRRQLRIPSRTDGLEFTALAARFESRVEETFLAGLVHMGV